MPTRVRASVATRRAWWSLLGFVPSFVLAFVVGEGIIAALGYDSGGDVQAPWWAVLVAGVPALVVFVVPAVLTVRQALQAMRLGDERAIVPMILALVVAGGFVLLNGLSALVVWLG